MTAALRVGVRPVSGVVARRAVLVRPGRGSTDAILRAMWGADGAALALGPREGAPERAALPRSSVIGAGAALAAATAALAGLSGPEPVGEPVAGRRRRGHRRRSGT